MSSSRAFNHSVARRGGEWISGCDQIFEPVIGLSFCVESEDGEGVRGWGESVAGGEVDVRFFLNRVTWLNSADQGIIRQQMGANIFKRH
jgi:hypothetical protein